MPTTEPSEILSPDFLVRLERLAVVARKALRGVGRGERRSKRHGGSVEFADYRGYAPGDDTRQIDWYAYARLEELYLKLFVEEQDLTLHLLLDQSASMGVGEPTKLAYARCVAVALAYIALAGGDRVTVCVVRDAAPARAFRGRGRSALARLLTALARDPAASGKTSLSAAVAGFLARRPSPGTVVLCSDLLDPSGHRPPLDRLLAAGHEVHLLHVLTPEELAPRPGADAELVDSETGRAVSIALTQRAVRRYRRAFAAWHADIVAFCRRRGVGYVLARTDVPFEDLVLSALRRADWIR
ncbi:MAG: DUF58 domain-containing protein [Planctomycetota bacterium]|nr:MAG: DUF58 domain-containing protein [Planctomycetota bacterium]